MTNQTNSSKGGYQNLKDFLRINNLKIWDKNDPLVLEIRRIRISPNSPNLSNWTNWTNSKESFANLIITLINLDCYLLDKMLRSLEQKFITQGGYSENLFKKRLVQRKIGPI